MEKYRALLESQVVEDVVLGLFLSHRDGLLPDFYRGKLNTTERFVVQFDQHSIWATPSELAIDSGDKVSRYTKGANYYGEFDFRTKKEDNKDEEYVG